MRRSRVSDARRASSVGSHETLSLCALKGVLLFFGRVNRDTMLDKALDCYTLSLIDGYPEGFRSVSSSYTTKNWIYWGDCNGVVTSSISEHTPQFHK